MTRNDMIICSSGFGGEKWKINVLLTALLCPGYVDMFCIMRESGIFRGIL